MSAARVFDLLADLIGPAANDSPRSPPANAANSANRKHPCGFAADSDSAKALRIPANPATAAPAGGQDSQTFAADSQHRNRPESEHWRGSSQDSQDSQQGVGGNAANDPGDREAFEERAAILEFDAGLPRAEAERQARAMLSPSADRPRVTVTSGNPQDRPHKLTPAAADAAHAEPWSEATCGRFVARVSRFLRLGIGVADADDLAERQHLLDVQAEGRVLCLTCSHLAGHATAGWRCTNHKRAGVGRDLPAALVTTAQRCPGFKRDE